MDARTSRSGGVRYSIGSRGVVCGRLLLIRRRTWPSSPSPCRRSVARYPCKPHQDNRPTRMKAEPLSSTAREDEAVLLPEQTHGPPHAATRHVASLLERGSYLSGKQPESREKQQFPPMGATSLHIRPD